MKWIPKFCKDSNDECKPNGPTFIRGIKSLYLKIYFVGNLEGEHATMLPGLWVLKAHDWGQIKVYKHLL